MYEEYWGLKEKPFENTPDPKFLYYSPQHEEALARMFYVVRESKGAGMLTGVYGCGKTVLGRVLLAELQREIYKVAFITNPRLDDVELLRMISYNLGSPELPTRKTDILITLEKILVNNVKDGKKTVVLIDESHTIEDKNVYEEIRLLLNFQLEDKFLLTILLIGQPELKEKVEANKQLLQRIAMRYHLEPLSREETFNYINHRLKIAGGEKLEFAPGSYRLIHERAGGIPRRINQICDMCLFTGYGKKVKLISEEIVQEAIEGLER